MKYNSAFVITVYDFVNTARLFICYGKKYTPV